MNTALLLTTAAIWGFAFVAQRAGMELIGPLTYNGVRFTLGLISLLPFFLLSRRAKPKKTIPAGRKDIILWGCLTGLMLCAASALQQIGIVWTSAGKAGFVTGLYVVLVPLFGHFLGRRSGKAGWAGALLSIAGLYFISVEDFSINKGDLFIFASAFFFAAHVLLVAKNSSRFQPLSFALVQYALCAALSLAAALAAETWNTQAVLSAWLPIVYGGVFSIGIAYSLQIAALKTAHPTHASVLLSTAGLFAAAGGVLILSESFSPRELFGAGLMLCGTLVSRNSSLFRK
ncbi:MAG: DMT family transporter [Spirochaetales bacterium]|jgi:drug/metabolite transporter (DMT)-like permease|nr:DMT family transporter [Spirochaetales bacterium]